jgi:hypothetical protein
MAGYVWIYAAFDKYPDSSTNGFGGCLIKHVTNVPCPSCGATRSAISFLKGDFAASLAWNPVGIILVCIGLVVPVWILADVISKKESFFKFFGKTEILFRKRMIAVPAIGLILANWIWNIYKGL